MNFLSEFESRIGSVFGDAPQGYTEPFSFKKLAKRAAKEMEAETYEIQGVATAPALYTVLVSPSDDSLMRPLYPRITKETGQYLAAEAEKSGYALVGMPLVRFMIDPSLRSGKFAVFAENVDYHALERLRAEEEAFMGSNSSLGGAASVSSAANANNSNNTDNATSEANASEESDIPGILPLPEIGAASALAAVPSLDDSVADGLNIVVPDAFEPQQEAAGTPGVAAVPATQRRISPVVDTRQGVEVKRSASCILVDRTTGRTHSAKAPAAVIGRERSQADIILSDPNVSRRHAQLIFDGRSWHIQDLNSTNGTRVNDIEVNECVLSDGDIITCGLVSLEFRES